MIRSIRFIGARVAAASLALVIASRVGAEAQGLHAVHDTEWHANAVTPGVLRARLKHAADEYASFAPVPRVALTDIAYPADSAEAIATGGYALLLVMAVAQDSTELPLTRLYVRTASGEEEELVPYRSSLAREGGGSAEATVFGKFRQDALYLLPLHAALRKGELIADFAAHRSGFTLMQWVGGPAGVVSVPSRAVGDAERAALESFARREYPELFAQ